MNESRPTRRSIAYDAVLGVLGGSALGWFAWWFSGAYVVSDGGGSSGISLWVFQVFAVVVVFFLLMRVRSRTVSEARRPWWVHLLWLPVILFAFLMVQAILILRNCC